MSHRRVELTAIAAGLLIQVAVITSARGVADEQRAASAVAEDSLSELTSLVSRSLVVVRAAGRDGNPAGLGTGFAIGDSGLIVTARHVIGDGRDIIVELGGERTVAATEVFASSSQLDLAVIRIPESSLPALQLGSDELITQGREVIAMGHPRGLKNSVVDGVISGRREIDGISMIQLAMPVEPGNSGGPVVDRQGRVVGIVTLKSTASENLGFALPVDLLHNLLKDPNPVPMSRWRTIGALDERQWTTLFGANWRQRAGRITVNGQGQSFGGRSLCLSTRNTDAQPLELQVTVRLNDESGAAGLVFHSDGGEKHYGFYPSAGNLRLTRFDGPDVDSWTILHNAPHPSYHAGTWNTLRVTILPNRFICRVNDQVVVESTDPGLSPGQVGLAAFRGTEAEFRSFFAGPELPGNTLAPEVRQILQAAAGRLQADRPASEDLIAELVPHARHAADYLDSEADRLEALARQMRSLSDDVHEARICDALVRLLTPENTPSVAGETDAGAGAEKPTEPPRSVLLRAALLVASLDNPEVDIEAYLDRLDQMAGEIRMALPENASDTQRLEALDQYLFEQNGFRGSRFDYYTKSNSYINEVIDDREGLPITLSIVYIALAERLGLNVTGVGLPGHFVVRFQPSADSEDGQLIDPFERGRRLSADEAAQRLREAGFANLPRYYKSQTPSEITQRMLLNLLNLAESSRHDKDVLRYLEVLVEIAPEEPEYRAKRLEIRARTGRTAAAIADANWFIQHQPQGTDQDRVRQLRSILEQHLEQEQTQRR